VPTPADIRTAWRLLLCLPHGSWRHERRHEGRMDASTSDGALPTRRVYIDAGANWANTLRLYRDIEPTASTAPWEVYAFEASPLITPFLERYCAWLDGGGIGVAPSSCLPQSGSTAHLFRYTSAVGCPESRECMWSFFAKPLAALAPDPRLNSTELIQKRLAKAQRASSRTRYTLIPAGVAAENTHITIDSNPQQLIRGGALTVDANPSRYPQAGRHGGRPRQRQRLTALPATATSGPGCSPRPGQRRQPLRSHAPTSPPVELPQG